jgi:hypothetical protein
LQRSGQFGSLIDGHRQLKRDAPRESGALSRSSADRSSSQVSRVFGKKLVDARHHGLSQVRAKTPFEAGSSQFFLRDRLTVAQIFDNLVEREVNSVSDLSQTGAKQTQTFSNESLIPAQNQRWRRA